MAVAAMRVPTIFTAVDRFSGVVSKMTGGVSAFGRTAEAAAMRTSRRMNAMGTSMLYTGAGMAIGLGYAVNEAGKFEKAIANISTLTEKSPAQMKAYGDSILSIAKKVPVAISDLTDAGYDVVSAGIVGTSNQLNVLNRSAILAVAGLGSTKEAVDITTSSLNAFGIEASESESVTNKLMKTVKYGKTTVSGISESFGNFASIMKNSNVTLDEYLASAAALTTTGMSMSRAQTQVSSATTALIKPNKSMLAIYQRLGVKDVPKFIKESGGLVASLDKVNGVATKMGITMSKVMGRKEGLSAFLSLTGAQRDKFNEIMLDMASGTDVVNTAFAKQQKTFSAGMQRMKNSAGVLAIKIGEELLPRINGFIDRLTPTIDGITGWMQKNEGLATTLLNVALGLMALGVVMKVGAVLFYGLGKAIALVTFMSEAYTAVSLFFEAALLAQAFSGAALSTVMFTLAGSLLAVYWPVLLIVAALGGLAYVMSDSIFSTENMVSKQTSALDKQNEAWRNSTKVQSAELRKQKNNMSVAGTVNTNMGNLSGVLANAKENKRIQSIANVEHLKKMELASKNAPKMSMATVNGQMSFSGGVAMKTEERPVNLAGSPKTDEAALNNFIKKLKLDINVNDPGNVINSIGNGNGENYTGGIPAKVGNTTGQR